MRIKKWIQPMVVCSSILILAACNNTRYYANAVNSWQGASAHALFHHWGAPNEITQLPHGNRMYLYRRVERETFSQTYLPATTRVSAQEPSALLSRPSSLRRDRVHTFWCNTWFEVNPHAVIVNTRFTGNHCATTESGAKRWSYWP